MTVLTSNTPGSIAPMMWTPVSGTAYRQDYGCQVASISLTVTINPTALLGAGVLAEVSDDDGSNWFSYGSASVPAGLTLASATQQIFLQVPSNWLFRFTATRATLGTMFVIRQP